MGLVVIVVSAAGWAHGQLANPGFEDSGGSLVGWQEFGNTVGNVTVSSLTPRSGSWAASISGQSSSDAGSSYAGIYQGVASAPEIVWTASAYFRHSSGSTLAEENRLLMKVELYRSFGGIYGTADLISETEITVLDAGSSADVWHEATLRVLGPSDAVEARIAFVFAQQGSAGGTALIDDVSFTASGDGLGPPEGVAWSLLWHDEFDGASIDQSKWRVLDAHLIKNDELQYYDPEDVYLENGCLVLRSRQHDPPVIRPHPYGYDTEFEFTSGLVESPGLFSHTYGWIEVRARLPSTQGLWPAHWMLGENIAEIGWPRCGEVDIMELLGHDVDTVYFTRHWGDPVVHQGFSYSGPDFSQDFHTFAIHWTPEKIDWYVDGSLRYQTTITDAGDIFRKPFYLILNTAVGGYWPGHPDETTVFPQYHEIDYVRWYVESDPGDFDHDGDVDTDDEAAFTACFGDGETNWNDPACRFFDTDADNHVDCDDWHSFREVWSGPPTAPSFAECRSTPRRIRRRHSAGPG
jgi:beta-glucanase (GH16 family)